MLIAIRSKLKRPADRTSINRRAATTNRSISIIQLIGRFLVRRKLHQFVEPQLWHIILLRYHSLVLPPEAAAQRIDFLHHEFTTGRAMLLPADLHQLLVGLDLKVFVQVVFALDLPQTGIVAIGHHELFQQLAAHLASGVWRHSCCCWSDGG